MSPLHTCYVLATAATTALGAVIESPAPWGGGSAPSAVAATSALGALNAIADPASDRVEVRDIRGTLRRVITRAQIQALVGSVALSDSLDGPSALAFSDSGRLLFIAVRDDANGATGDAVLRYDTATDDLRLFATLDFGDTSATQRPSMAHFKGRLFVATPGALRAYRAQMNDLFGAVQPSSPLLNIRSLALDRDSQLLYAEAGGQLYRASTVPNTLAFTAGPLIAPTQCMTYADHYGSSAPGLFFVSALTPNQISFATAQQAQGFAAWTPAVYASAASPWSSIGAAADGSMLAARADAVLRLTDSSDTRLSFDAFAHDEFNQVVAFGRSLITPNLAAPGTPAGWVIDADVQLGWTRFHPASADGAAWTIMLLLMSEEINGDSAAHNDIRAILRRYSGRATDGVAPLRSADGIYWHWLNPATGGDAGWGDSYATMSTMKMVLAADRAWKRYPGDADIEASARAIICGVRNWDSYFTPGDARMALLGLAGGGANGGSFSAGWHEGLMFAEEAGVFGGVNGGNAATRWRTRSSWPQASLVTGRPVTVGAGGVHLAGFITAYALLTSPAFRADPAWREHCANLRISSAAWTDDNGPRYFTVFSAGTTRGDWGGYNADSFSNHPGDLTTFTALEALSLDGASARCDEVASAYHAYRRGARQTFLGGASILYRRSRIDLAYQPDSAGLPDVAMGGLALGEFLLPGSIDRVLANPYRGCSCPADFNHDGGVDGDDVLEFFAMWDAGLPGADFNGDDGVDGDDVLGFFERWDAGC